jgi:tetratricopeptide (TPR) repeat protein
MAYVGKGEPTAALGAWEPAFEGAVQIRFQQGSAEARPLILRILALRPDDPTSHAMLCFLEYRDKDCANAVSDFEKGSQVLPAQPNALGAYGSCLATLSRYDDSVAVFQQALAAMPGSRRFRLNLAVAQRKANHSGDALITLQPLMEASPADGAALLLAADIYESTNDTAHAVELLRKAILVNPKNVDEYQNFAGLSYDHASMQVGIDILDAGLTQLPKEGRLYLVRGVLYAQLGRFSEASADFETANRLDPSLSFTGVAEGLGL